MLLQREGSHERGFSTDVDYMVRTLAERYGIELEEDRKVREAMEKVKEAGK